jgi:hypothetical protein
MRLEPDRSRPRPRAARRPSLPAVLLRLEGVALFAAAWAAFVHGTGAPPWMLLVWLLAPDLVALGYLAGPRAGAILYDLGHATVGPLVALALGVALDATPIVAVATVWLAHIGMDRAVGYGLKYLAPDRATHLQRV